MAAQSNCQVIFGPNSNGKLIEPATMPTFDKILLAAKQIWGYRDFHVGIQKIDNHGTLKYSSTGREIPADFWSGASLDVTDGMDELYICYYTSQIKWHDCDTHELASICEFSMEMPARSGLYNEIDILKTYYDQQENRTKGKN